MNISTQSDYLRHLVEQGMIESDVAEAIGELPHERARFKATQAYIQGKNELLAKVMSRAWAYPTTEQETKRTPEEQEAFFKKWSQKGPLSGLHGGYVPNPNEVRGGYFRYYQVPEAQLAFPAEVYTSPEPHTYYVQELLRHRIIVGSLAEEIRVLTSEELQFEALSTYEGQELTRMRHACEEVRKTAS